MPATLCVYALVPAGAERVSARGLAGARLRIVRGGAVAAIVARTARRTKPSEQNLRAYLRTMQALMRQFPSLVPVRFGTYVDDESEIDGILRARQATIRRTLAHVRNRAQMTLRMVRATQEAAGRGPGGTPSRRSGRPGTGEGGQESMSGAEFLRARAAAQAVPELDLLRPAIRRWIRDERAERRDRVISVYHLVPRGSAAAYRDAVTGAATTHGVRVLVSGPWPAYAFTAPW